MTSTIPRPAVCTAAPVDAPPAGSDSRVAVTPAVPTSLALREPNSPPAEPGAATAVHALAGIDSHATTTHALPELGASRGSNVRPAMVSPAPAFPALAGSDSRPAMTPASPTFPALGGDQLAADLRSIDAQSAGVGSNQTARHTALDAQQGYASGRESGGDRAAGVPPPTENETLFDPALALAADFLDDVERVKIANENRLRALTRVATDKDGIDRYVGLDTSHPVVEKLASMVASLAEVEHAAVLNLQRLLRKHPLGAWMKSQKGIGEKQGARLLAAIGDPYWRPEITREDGTVIPEGPRTVSALWAYCGLHVLPAVEHGRIDTQGRSVGSGGQTGAGGDLGQAVLDDQVLAAGVAARRRKGVQANWSTKAKMRAYLIAESCLKQIKAPCHAADFEGRWLAVHYDECVCSPYRLVYDARKSHTSLTRPEWTDGHRHADALRVASKAILKDLWIQGRAWHLAQRERAA